MPGRTGRAGTAEAGDAEVEFEETEHGGTDIVIVPTDPSQGRTDGEAIDTEARELLAELGVANCRVTVRDHSAPGWVARARLEAAARRAGVTR